MTKRQAASSQLIDNLAALSTAADHSSQKADLLNRQYQSQFTKERLTDLPQEQESQFPSMPDITVYNEGVVKLLQQLSPFKAAGPDGITPYVLKTAAEEIAPALTIIFQKSLDTGTVPLDWLCANITPIFKKGDRTSPANYRSVNLTSVCSKILEHILHTNIMRHLDSHKILCHQQHGFRKNHSWMWNTAHFNRSGHSSKFRQQIPNWCYHHGFHQSLR